MPAAAAAAGGGQERRQSQARHRGLGALTRDRRDVHQSCLGLGGVVGLPANRGLANHADAVHSSGAGAPLRPLGEQAWLRHIVRRDRSPASAPTFSAGETGACRAALWVLERTIV